MSRPRYEIGKVPYPAGQSQQPPPVPPPTPHLPPKQTREMSKSMGKRAGKNNSLQAKSNRFKSTSLSVKRRQSFQNSKQQHQNLLQHHRQPQQQQQQQQRLNILEIRQKRQFVSKFLSSKRGRFASKYQKRQPTFYRGRRGRGGGRQQRTMPYFNSRFSNFAGGSRFSRSRYSSPRSRYSGFGFRSFRSSRRNDRNTRNRSSFNYGRRNSRRSFGRRSYSSGGSRRSNYGNSRRSYRSSSRSSYGSSRRSYRSSSQKSYRENRHSYRSSSRKSYRGNRRSYQNNRNNYQTRGKRFNRRKSFGGGGRERRFNNRQSLAFVLGRQLQVTIMKDASIANMSLYNCVSHVFTVYRENLTKLEKEIQADIAMMRKQNSKDKTKTLSYLKRAKNASNKTAVYYLTKAILKSPEANKNNWLAYEAFANRAQIFFRMGRYLDAAHDANIALNHRYTLSLSRIAALCYVKMAQSAIFARSRPAEMNERYANFYLGRAEEECLKQMVISANKTNNSATQRLVRQIEAIRKKNALQTGNHESPLEPNYITTNIFENVTMDAQGNLIARKAMKKNSLVFFENFLAFMPNNSQYCGFCCRKIGSRIYPCRGCSEVVFCDQICSNLAIGSRHGNICTYSSRVYRQLGPLAMLAYQLLAQTPLAQLIKQSMFAPKKVLGALLASPEKAAYSEFAYYNLIFNRTPSADQITMDSPRMRVLLCTALRLTLIIHSKFPNLVSHVPLESLAPLTMVAFSTLYYLNQCPFAKKPIKHLFKGRLTSVGSGLGSFGARLQFSCQANVMRRFRGNSGKIEYRAALDISQGERLTVSCGVNTNFPVEKRQHFMRRWYGIQDCTCQMCGEQKQQLNVARGATPVPTANDPNVSALLTPPPTPPPETVATNPLNPIGENSAHSTTPSSANSLF